MRNIPLTPISRFAFTAATQCVECPYCKSKPGEFCTMPSGRTSAEPHMERMKAYNESISPEEYRRRHQIKSEGWNNILSRMQRSQ